MKRVVVLLLLSTLPLGGLGCSDDSPSGPTNPKVAEILSAPERVTVLGQELSVGWGYQTVEDPLRVWAILGAVQPAPVTQPWVAVAEVWAVVNGRLFTTSSPIPGPRLEYEHDSVAYRFTDYVQVTTMPNRQGTQVVLAVGVYDANDELVLIRSKTFRVLPPR